MDLYTLDESLRRDNIVEGFESRIWTERYSAWGDFELKMKSSRETRNLLPEGTLLAHDGSYRVMRVEDIEDGVDDEGENILTITGRSIEALLEDRVAMPAFAGLATTPKWELTGTPGGIIREMFQTICVTGALDTDDVFPFYTAGTLLPAGNIPEPLDPVTISFDPDSLYNSTKKACDVYNLGFRIVRNGEESELYYEVYTGDDRTSAQNILPAVIFSPALNNLTNTAKLTSIAQLKNIAYVFGKNGSTVVYATSVDPGVSGFDRRVLIVKADDIDLPAGAPLESALQQKGLEELAKYRKVFTFDGESSGSYQYGIDYDLGDLVEQRDEDGFGSYMRVTEQIFVSDVEGERSYPTLSVDTVLNPGTWLSWDPNESWSEVDPEVYWNTA